ncbi:MAG: hypothetical protein RLZ53_940 [Actinomycetota bacterium]|jgi:uncharacterized LabA/DUF88 family protein
MGKPTAIVYIDGLNLQRRLLDQTPTVDWVDYWKLAQVALPHFELVYVKVFVSTQNSADVIIANEIWSKQMQRQHRLQIHVGRVKKTTRIYPATESMKFGEDQGMVKVLKYEEKGSDVALAASMVLDASRNLASIYYLVSSDTDFEPVVRILKKDLGVRTGVLCTAKNIPKLFLELGPEDLRHIKVSHVEKSSFKESEPSVL